MGSTTSTQSSSAQRNSSAEFPTKVHLYYAIARALLRGYSPPSDEIMFLVDYDAGPSRRPGLPIELVLEIFDLAEIIKPTPTASYTIRSHQPCYVRSIGPVQEALFFHSPPLSRAFLAHVRQMQLYTVSRDQGWASQPEAGSWSWFEVAILQPVDDADGPSPSDIIELDFSWLGKAGEDFAWRGELFPRDHRHFDRDTEISEPNRTSGERSSSEHAAQFNRVSIAAHASEEGIPAIFDDPPSSPLSRRYRQKPRLGSPMDACRWLSHHNALAVPVYQSLSGEIFGTGHEIWRNLKEGDVIAVYARARFSGWQNHARDGKLEFWEKFDPRRLADLPKEDKFND